MPLPSSPPLQELHRLDGSSSDFQDQLSNVLHGVEFVQCVPHLEGGDLVWLVKYLDQVSGPHRPPPLSAQASADSR